MTEEERRIGTGELLQMFRRIDEKLDRIELSHSAHWERTNTNSDRIGKVESKVNWIQGIGVGIGVVLAAVGQIKRWWN